MDPLPHHDDHIIVEMFVSIVCQSVMMCNLISDCFVYIIFITIAATIAAAIITPLVVVITAVPIVCCRMSSISRSFIIRCSTASEENQENEHSTDVVSQVISIRYKDCFRMLVRSSFVISELSGSINSSVSL